MNVDAEYFVDMAVLEEEVEYAEVAEEEVESQVTITIHYLVYMVIELLFLKLRYRIEANINHCHKNQQTAIQ